MDKLADVLQNLAGPMSQELGEMFADKARDYRLKNWIKTAQRTDRILKDAGLTANAVPPGLLLPIIESCSIEEGEALKERWAGLLATASQEAATTSPSFVETLKQLSPDEAQFLDPLM